MTTEDGADAEGQAEVQRVRAALERWASRLVEVEPGPEDGWVTADGQVARIVPGTRAQVTVRRPPDDAYRSRAVTYADLCAGMSGRRVQWRGETWQVQRWMYRGESHAMLSDGPREGEIVPPASLRVECERGQVLA